MPSLACPWHPSPPITRSWVVVTFARSSGTPPLLYFVSTISLSSFSHHLHVAFASTPCISSSHITYPLNLHSPSYSTAYPLFLVWLSHLLLWSFRPPLDTHTPTIFALRCHTLLSMLGLVWSPLLKSPSSPRVRTPIFLKLLSRLGWMSLMVGNLHLTGFLEHRIPSPNLTHEVDLL